MEKDKKNDVENVVIPEDFKFQEDNPEQSFSDVVPKDLVAVNMKDEKAEAEEIAEEEEENDDDDEEETPVKNVPKTKEETEVAQNKTIQLIIMIVLIIAFIFVLFMTLVERGIIKL